MASPRLLSAAGVRGGVVLSSPANGGGDEATWRRLREAGFDEETVKRKDKAALISYICKLEAELYEHQHQMGLLLIDRKEWNSKYEQLKASTDTSEISHKRERAAQASALAEAAKREESLKKAFSIEKECVANIEKALHDTRVEWAETKVAYENKLVEARQLSQMAQEKLDEAEEKLLSARSIEADAIRARDAARRSIQDVEARDDELRRRLVALQFEHDAKEQDLSLQRKSLSETQKLVHQQEERLLEKESLLNQRELYILDRMESLNRREKQLEVERLQLEADRRSFLEEKSNLDLNIAAISAREEATIERESLLDRRERELLILQETIASKEQAEIERLTNEHQSLLDKRRTEFDAELEKKRALIDEELEARRSSFDDIEWTLKERINSVTEKEHSLDLKLADLAEKEEELARESKRLKEFEERLNFTKREHDTTLQGLEKVRHKIEKMKLDLERDKASLKEEREDMLRAQGVLEITEGERNELAVLERKLKEEIDSFRAQKKDLLAEAERLQSEKEQFEIEWEMVDERKEDLVKEAERLENERRVMTEHLREEHESLKREKEELRVQLKRNAESLAHERDEFMRNMQAEHAGWLSRMEKEHADFKKDMELQKAELQESVNARREELESYLREREAVFEKKKDEEMRYLESQKEIVAKQFELLDVGLSKLEKEREEIAVERSQREKEINGIKDTIEVLNVQREKLKEQRDLLRVDRESINQQIKQLNELEEANQESERRALYATAKLRTPVKKVSECNILGANGLEEKGNTNPKEGSGLNLLVASSTVLEGSNSKPTPASWVRRCAGVIFKRSPEDALLEASAGGAGNGASVSGRKRPSDDGGNGTPFEPQYKLRKRIAEKDQNGGPVASSGEQENEGLLHVGNGGPHDSDKIEILSLHAEEEVVVREYEEPLEEMAPVECAQTPIRGDQDLDGEEDDDAEAEVEPASAKQKLWNFLITLIA